MFNQFQSSFGQPVQSQYRGSARQFQPTGIVQSYYGGQQQSMINPQAQSYHTAGYAGNQPGHDNYLRADSTRPGSFSAVTAQSYHTASYAGNKQGHDQHLRADATSPSSMGMGIGQAVPSFRSSFVPAQSFAASQFGGGFQQHQVNPSSYHTANYVGNQSGHDNYLRADSTNPSMGRSQGMGMMSTSFRNV
ncbi:hypothetical protein [Paenibacillus thermotolerans]|uniref:hypothetical protein n=1 Tax=Paenibacillus thermotolerans TaxID=3027807 RepID=UPI0023684E99|nr:MULTISPECIES: hypothetical protein [unclassified Paenibacillus]